MPRIRRHPARAGVTLLLLIGTLGSMGVATAARAPGPSSRPAEQASPQSNPRLEDSPGWVPTFDPESASVTTGRRSNAPLVSTSFKGGAHSLDQLGQLVCRQLHHKNADSLLALCVADSDFRDVMWREFPQSRPATGLTWEEGWTPLLQRLISGCASAVNEYGMHWFAFQRFETDSIAHYKNFTLYSRVTLVAKDDEGKIQRMRWLRAIVERKGRFKIYSTAD